MGDGVVEASKVQGPRSVLRPRGSPEAPGLRRPPGEVDEVDAGEEGEEVSGLVGGRVGARSAVRVGRPTLVMTGRVEGNRTDTVLETRPTKRLRRGGLRTPGTGRTVEADVSHASPETSPSSRRSCDVSRTGPPRDSRRIRRGATAHRDTDHPEWVLYPTSLRPPGLPKRREGTLPSPENYFSWVF